MRKMYSLSTAEWREFKNLPPFPHFAISFWKRVAMDRNLDPSTVISNSGSFTALPKDHGKWWCFPMSLKCKRRPIYKDE